MEASEIRTDPENAQNFLPASSMRGCVPPYTVYSFHFSLLVDPSSLPTSLYLYYNGPCVLQSLIHGLNHSHKIIRQISALFNSKNINYCTLLIGFKHYVQIYLH